MCVLKLVLGKLPNLFCQERNVQLIEDKIIMRLYLF